MDTDFTIVFLSSLFFLLIGLCVGPSKQVSCVIQSHKTRRRTERYESPPTPMDAFFTYCLTFAESWPRF